MNIDSNMLSIGVSHPIRKNQRRQRQGRRSAGSSKAITRKSHLPLTVKIADARFSLVDHKGVARSLRFLATHWHKPIGVAELTKVAGMSRRGFHKAFLHHIGRPPGHELERLRMERARKLLVTSQHETEIIARKCGYESANTFFVAFKRSEKISPGQFRIKMTR